MSTELKPKYRGGVAGFFFNEGGDFVALIRKAKPDWQAGKLNGIGGKIEPGEHPASAMRREFEEETGLFVPVWNHFLTITEDPSFPVFFFWAVGDPTLVRTTIDEPVSVRCSRTILRGETVPNLEWILPMARSFCTNPYSRVYSLRGQADNVILPGVSGPVPPVIPVALPTLGVDTLGKYGVVCGTVGPNYECTYPLGHYGPCSDSEKGAAR